MSETSTIYHDQVWIFTGIECGCGGQVMVPIDASSTAPISLSGLHRGDLDLPWCPRSKGWCRRG